MSDRLLPRQRVPDLLLPLVNDTKWTLEAQKPGSFSLLVFYRGLHCPICKRYLKELSGRIADFASLGVDPIAISMDSEDRAKRAWRDWDLQALPVGYGLSVDEAKRWRLYISEGRANPRANVEEPAHFSEPGTFLIRPDKTLFFASIQSMPFARPHIDDLLSAIDFIKKNNLEPRGENSGGVQDGASL